MVFQFTFSQTEAWNWNARILTENHRKGIWSNLHHKSAPSFLPNPSIRSLTDSLTLSHPLRIYFSVVVSSTTSASSPSLLETSPLSSSSPPRASDVQLIRIGLRGSRSNYSILLPNLNAPNKEDRDSSLDVIQGEELPCSR